LSFKAANASQISGLDEHAVFLADRALVFAVPAGALKRMEGGEYSMFRDFFRRLHINALTLRSEDGQTMAEYGVVLSVITIAAVAAFLALGGKINGAISAVTNLLKTG